MAKSTPGAPTNADLPRLKRYFTESEQLTQPARKNALVALISRTTTTNNRLRA